MTAKRQLTFPLLFNTEQVAHITGKSEETIRRWCREGRVSHSTLGGEYRFSDAQVNQFLIQHEPARLPLNPTKRGARK